MLDSSWDTTWLGDLVGDDMVLASISGSEIRFVGVHVLLTGCMVGASEGNSAGILGPGFISLRWMVSASAGNSPILKLSISLVWYDFWTDFLTVS